MLSVENDDSSNETKLKIIEKYKKCYKKINCTKLWRWLVLIILIPIGIVASIITPVLLKQQENEKNVIWLTSLSSQVNSYIVRDLNRVINLIRRSNAYVDYFGIFLNNSVYINFLFIEPRIQARIELVAFLPIINNSSLPQYTDFCKSIVSTCNPRGIGMVNGTVALVPLIEGANYVFLTQSAPSDRILDSIIGIDLASYPSILDQVWNATANISTSSRLRLNGLTVDSKSKAYGVIMSQKTPIGYSIAAFYADQLIANTLYSLVGQDNAVFNVFDISNPIESQQLLYASSPNIKTISEVPNGTSTISTTISVGSRTWAIYYTYSNILTSDVAILISAIIIPLFIVLITLSYIITVRYYVIRNELTLEKVKKDYDFSNRMIEYVNHEMRNPLNGVLGLTDLTALQLEERVDLLQKSPIVESSTIEQELEQIRNMLSNLYTVKRLCALMKHIVDDILDIRKIESEKLILYPEYINIPNFIKELLVMVDYKVQEKYPAIALKVDITTKSEVYVDKQRLTQILLNYLTNAFKFTDQGCIYIKVYDVSNAVRFEIEDTGRGIPSNKFKNIFKPFSQTNQEDSSRYGGVGLGLYLCKILSNIMSCKVGFSSIYKEGSKFWIDINGESVFDNIPLSQ